MSEPNGRLGRGAVRAAALLVIVALYGFARQPQAPAAERERLAARFAFARAPLWEPPGMPRRSVRPVHPSLERIAAWISSVGAGVALADLDGDGLGNDICHVETRSDQVTVAPAPGTGARYAPFVLDPAPLPYARGETAPMGCLPGDFDEDGVADLLVYYWGRTPILFLRRTAAAGPLAAASYLPRELAAKPERWYTNAATRADLDGDGHADLLFGNYFQDGARILAAGAPGRELMQESMSRAQNGGRNRVFLWRGARPGAEPDVRFAEAPGVLTGRCETGWTLALGAADLDGDLLPEVYVGNDFGPDCLLHNRSRPGRPRLVPLAGRKTLTTPNSKVLGRDSFKGMGVDFADVNGDARLDLYVSNIAQEYALEESHFVWVSRGGRAGARRSMLLGRAPYAELSEDLGLSRSAWGWDCRFADFDNDGVHEAVQATGFVRGRVNRWPELHQIAMANDYFLRFSRSWLRIQQGDDLSGHEPNPFFVRAAGGRFHDVAAEVGIDQPMVTRALAVADVDGDGRLDFAAGNQWQASYLYRNRAPAAGASLVLDLRLAARDGGVGPEAVGAAVSVRLFANRRLVAQVDGGSGHSGKRSPEVHLGLGRRIAPGATVPVEISWRDRAGLHRDHLRLPPGRHRVLLAARAEVLED